MHVLPWSETGMPFGEHFRLTSRRLEACAPLLRAGGLRVGLEFIGAFGLRRVRRRDFVHTLEGVRCLVAAAGCEDLVGLKLDSYHWWATGGSLEDILKLDPHEVHALARTHTFLMGNRKTRTQISTRNSEGSSQHCSCGGSSCQLTFSSRRRTTNQR